MLTVYTSYNCSSCKKVIEWLDENGIGYREVNFFSKTLLKEDILKMLEHTEEGFDDILSNRSNVYMRESDKIQNMKINELIELIIMNPTILKRPILIDDVTDLLIVGYKPYELQLLA